MKPQEKAHVNSIMRFCKRLAATAYAMLLLQYKNASRFERIGRAREEARKPVTHDGVNIVTAALSFVSGDSAQGKRIVSQSVSQ